MCNYKILAHSKSGYIILCNGCCNYQLAFGTTAVTFETEGFKNFCHQIICLCKTSTSNGFDKEKQFHINLFSKTSLMVLSYKELERLNILVGEAMYSEKIDSILNENNITTLKN